MTKKVSNIEKEIADIEARRAELFELLKPINEELDSIRVKLEKLRDKRDSIYIKTKSNDWPWILDASEESSVKYNFVRDKLQQIGLSSDGYRKESNQLSIRIQLQKNSKESYEETINGLKLLLPFLKPIHSQVLKAPAIQISIFEHTLNQYGVYYLLVQTNKLFLEKAYGSHSQIIKEFISIEDAIKWIQENHWYDGDYDRPDSPY